MSEALYEQRPLEDAVERHIGGGTPPRQVLSYWKGEIPWASVKDFPEQKGVIQDTEEHISSTGLHASASNLIPAQTPLVCTRMAVGRAALPVIPMAINQDVKALFPASGVSAEYLLKLMQYIQPLAEGRAVGSTVKGIRIQEYLNIPVPLAPQEAQPVIAQILDTLDTAIRETEALIDKLKAVKQGLLHDLLTRGIDANGQLRPPQSEAPQLYKESPLGWIPREWEICPLHQQADVIDPQPDHRTPKEQEDGVPYIGIGDFDEHGRVRFSSCRRVVQGAFEKQRQRFKIEDGDIIYGKIGTIGKPKRLVAGDYALTANVLLLKPKYSPALFFMLLTSAFEGQILDITNTTSQPALGIETVRNLLVYKVPRTESDLISERLNSIFSQISEETAMLYKLKQQKSGLMDDLLTGRVRVTPLLESMQQPDAPTGA